MRLIDANALIRKLHDKYRKIDNGRTFRQESIPVMDGMRMGELEYCIGLVQCEPIIEAEPVRHGRWVYGEDVDIQCSECGKDAMSDWMKYTQVYSNYCPHCGAKMDLK